MLSRKTTIIVFVLMFAAALVEGGLQCYRMFDYYQGHLRLGALHNAIAFPAQELETLAGAPSDTASPQYRKVVRDLDTVCGAHRAITYAGLLRYYPANGRVVSLAASGPEGAPAAGASRDNTPDARAAEKLALGGTQVAMNLFHRDWKGFCSSGYARCDGSTDPVVATDPPMDVFRYDINANKWIAGIAEGGLIHFFAVWLLLSLPFAAYLIGKRHRQRTLQILQFQEAVEQTETPIMIVRKDGRIKYANPSMCAQVGYARDELLGHPWRILRHANPPDEASIRRSAMLLEGISVEADWDFRRKDGTPFPVHVTVTPIRDETGKVVEAIFVTTDMTEYRQQTLLLQKQKDEAEQEDRIKTLILAAANSELGKPLDDIDALANETGGGTLTTEQSNYVDIIRKSSNSLKRLMRDIADFSHIESGRVCIEPVPADLRLLISETLDLVRAQAAARNIALKQQVAADVPAQVIIAADRLRQVLLNLVENALKFTESGEVEIKLKLIPSEELSAIPPETAPFVPKTTGEGRRLLFFSVRDTGIGIASEHSKNLFLPFWQADLSNTRRHGGAGLGLSISQQLVHLLGGEISIQSTPGRGTTFYFSAVCTIPTEKNREAVS